MTTKTKRLDSTLRKGDKFNDALGREVTVVDHLFFNQGRNVRLTLIREGTSKKWGVNL